MATSMPFTWASRFLESSPNYRLQSCMERFRKFDVSETGTLSWGELHALTVDLCEFLGLEMPQEEKLRLAFDRCDKNHDDVLQEAEFQRFFETFLRSTLSKTKSIEEETDQTYLAAKMEEWEAEKQKEQAEFNAWLQTEEGRMHQADMLAKEKEAMHKREEEELAAQKKAEKDAQALVKEYAGTEEMTAESLSTAIASIEQAMAEFQPFGDREYSADCHRHWFEHFSRQKIEILNRVFASLEAPVRVVQVVVVDMFGRRASRCHVNLYSLGGHSLIPEPLELPMKVAGADLHAATAAALALSPKEALRGLRLINAQGLEITQEMPAVEVAKRLRMHSA